jgi:hypothetical protein
VNYAMSSHTAAYLRNRRSRRTAARRLPSERALAKIRQAFDRKSLHDICVMPEDYFETYGDFVKVNQEAPDDFYYFKDNGSKVLAVAHLDSCEQDVMCSIADTADGPVVYSGSLDDRLGAYVILELLPKLGITCDWLLTTGEETGRSTAEFFEPPIDSDGNFKEYNWIIQFDRGGTDVVLYDYETASLKAMVEATGVYVGMGSFSDICKLEWLGCKGINWGVGYQDYHGPRAHAWLDETFHMVEAFMNFYESHAATYLEHAYQPRQESDNWVYYRDLENERYDGTMVLKGDRARSRSLDHDPAETCLGCMGETVEGYCFNCDDVDDIPPLPARSFTVG